MLRVALLILLILSLAAHPSAAQGIPSEISVRADAWAWVSPDHARITVMVEETGARAEEAASPLQNKTTQVLAAIKKAAGENVRIQKRSETYSGAGAPKSPITKSAAVRAKVFLGVETSKFDAIPKIIDAAVSAGASSVSEVEYSVRQNEKAIATAIAKATEKGKQKAERLARTLGVELGPLLSANVIEEPAAQTLRLQQARGSNLGNHEDQDLHVFVNLRFGIGNPIR